MQPTKRPIAVVSTTALVDTAFLGVAATGMFEGTLGEESVDGAVVSGD